MSWYNSSKSEQLVILGDVGHGKTVAMSFIIDELRRRSGRQLPQPKLCYYYCRDDGSGKALNIVSALILSLLEQLPGLKRQFSKWYEESQVSGIVDPATSITELGESLQMLLDTVDRPLFVVIDGLDECDRLSRNDLLGLLRSSSQKIPCLKTILSSRPQEEILNQLGDTAKIELRADTRRDCIIADKIMERRLPYLSADVKALVINKLSLSAQGSAIWTKTIIDILEIRKIMAFNPMQRFLDSMQLPMQLPSLYVTLLSRCTLGDLENKELARTALRLLVVAHRPLSILELAWAVALGTTQDVTTVHALAQLVDYQTIMSLIYPFISRVDYENLQKHQVRFVHQSVKEFVIDEWASQQPHPAHLDSMGSDQVIPSQDPQYLEAFILDICVRYLLEDTAHCDLFSEGQAAIAELPQGYDFFKENNGPVDYNPICTWEDWKKDTACFIRYDPADRGFGELFVYASCFWLEHLANGPTNSLPRLLARIEDLCQAGSTRLRNWIQQNCRPECTLTQRVEFNSHLYDPLGIAALYGSEAVLRDMLDNSSFNEDRFLRETALAATDQILQWGDVSRLKMLFLGKRLGHQLQNIRFFRLVIRKWRELGVHRHNWNFVFGLVDYVLDKMIEEKGSNDLLCIAASAGCVPFARRFISSAQGKSELRNELLREPPYEQQGPRAFRKPTHQSVGEAVLETRLIW